jgi:arylsulfatase A-like enzyme
LIDEAVAKVMAAIKLRGWDGDTDVLFTTDHGEFQGDFGLLFKGPHHVTSLMHLPLIWRPAPNANVASTTLNAPVGQVDFAPTFCEIAGVERPDWMEGSALPKNAPAADARETVFTEWDSEHNGVSVSLRTLFRDNWIVTAYGKSSIYEGTEGELYDLESDPLQWRNLWDEPAAQPLKKELLAELREKEPRQKEPRRPVVASV